MKSKHSTILGLMWIFVALVLTMGLIFGISKGDGNMKIGRIILGFIWIAVAAVLCFVLIKNVRGNKSKLFGNGITINSNGISILNGGGDSESLYREDKYSAENLSKAVINLSNEALRIEPVDGNEIIVELRGSGWSTENEPTVKMEKGVFTVETHKLINVSILSRTVIVKFPKNAVKDGNFILEGNSISGSVRIKNIDFKSLLASSQSGSVHLENAKASVAELKSTSGSVRVNADIDDLTANSSSGSVHVEGKCKEVHVKSISGSVRLDGAFEQIEASSTSGSVHCKSSTILTKDSSAKTVSGSVRMELPSNSSFKVRYSTTSGSYSNEFTDAHGNKHGSETVGSGNINLSVESVSGSVRIAKN